MSAQTLSTARNAGSVLEHLRVNAGLDRSDLIKPTGLALPDLIEAEQYADEGPLFSHLIQIATYGLKYFIQVRATYKEKRWHKAHLVVSLITSLADFENNFLEMLKRLFNGEHALHEHLEDYKTSLKELQSLLKLPPGSKIRLGEFLRYFQNLGVNLEILLVRIDGQLSDLDDPEKESSDLLQAYFAMLCKQLRLSDTDEIMLAVFGWCGLTRQKLQALQAGSLRLTDTYLSYLDCMVAGLIVPRFGANQLAPKMRQPNVGAKKPASQPAANKEKRKRSRQ